MRWRIRSQLLVPLLLLLLSVIASSVWVGVAAVGRAQRDIETRIRQVASDLIEKTNYPLQENVLQLMKGLSGADYLLMPPEGSPRTTLDQVPAELPPADTVCDDWHTLRLGPPLTVAGRTYLCGGIRLRPPRSGETLYFLYPHSLWRDALWQAMGPVVLLGGGIGLASLILAIGLGQSLSQRLGQLDRRTRLIAAGDFSPMPLPARNDEIRDLTCSVNDMAQKLAQYQQTVQRTERLRLLDQVSGGLAHQLRNGLTGARLAVQLYVQETDRGTDTTALAVALRQLNLLEANLKRFLDLGRSDCLQRVTCSLQGLIDEAVALLMPKCRHTGTALDWQRPTDLAVLYADPGQLEQMILNLLGNAIEAAGPGGSVCVRMGQGDAVWLEVWDSGNGILPEVAARLFEPFTTGKPEGLGLGLALSRQIVEAHGGRIRWFRDNGQTCFRVDLPRDAASLPSTKVTECAL